MTSCNPTGDSGGRSNPTNRATPEGGGSKVTSDSQRNPVSIRNKLFLLGEQGYMVMDSILFWDNKSTILLHENGKKSSGSRTQALNIQYFFQTDQVEKGNVKLFTVPK
jgi:hypothetical protein